jgi:hypothetical protein
LTNLVFLPAILFLLKKLRKLQILRQLNKIPASRRKKHFRPVAQSDFHSISAEPLMHATNNKLPVASTTMTKRSFCKAKTCLLCIFSALARLFLKKENSLNVEQIAAVKQQHENGWEEKETVECVHPPKTNHNLQRTNSLTLLGVGSVGVVGE